MSDKLKQYNSMGKSNSHYTIYIINQERSDFIKYIYDKLDKLNNSIKDTYKRKLANDIIYSLIKYLESSKTEIFNSIFLVNEKEVIELKLTKKDLRVANEWKINNIYFSYDDHFLIDYLYELFNDETIINVLRLNNKNLKILQINKTKSRTVDEIKNVTQVILSELYIKYKKGYIVGISSLLKNVNKSFIMLKGNKTNTDILENYRISKIKVNQEFFNDMILSKLSIESEADKFIFGRSEVSKAINDYMIKYLFITPKLYNKLSNSIDNSFLNFTIYQVSKIEPGDYGEQLIKDYGGIVGIKYY